MRLIKPYCEIIEQQPGVDGIYKQIELAGRTCYKSEDKITEDSAKAFVDRLIKSGHASVLEHGTVYLQYETVVSDINPLTKYYLNKYSKVKATGGVLTDILRLFVTTNLRVLVENDWLEDLKYICEPTKYHEKRTTVRFVCDMGVSHEFVRHRVMSLPRKVQDIVIIPRISLVMKSHLSYLVGQTGKIRLFIKETLKNQVVVLQIAVPLLILSLILKIPIYICLKKVGNHNKQEQCYLMHLRQSQL